MVGASGAISGVLGAYILLHPGAKVRVFIFLGIFFTVAHVPALIVLVVCHGNTIRLALGALSPALAEDERPANGSLVAL